MDTRYQSWGRYPRYEQSATSVLWRNAPLPLSRLTGKGTFLPFGNGRSYGDVCLNENGTLLDTRSLDRFIAFDPVKGIVRCESGVLLAEILELVVPRGWFLPVVPGTRFVTVGGAIANDIHGKNHHLAGSFCCHVRKLELLRSSGRRIICSPGENRQWFEATAGGLGLTGLIAWAEIELKKIANPVVEVETIRYSRLEDFFTLSSESDGRCEYTVAWLDCMATGKDMGRGLFMRANHAGVNAPVRAASRRNVTVPAVLPFSVVNRVSARIFNTMFYRKQLAARVVGHVHYQPFFFPLDGVLHWNRLYGPRGFLQHQCLLPLSDEGLSGLKEILLEAARSDIDSFLAVLKIFGEKVSPGLLSFPKPGITLALDFHNRGAVTLKTLERLDRVVASVGGRIYPAKDARMAAADYRRFFPEFEEMEKYRDPKFSSSFWRRTTGY